jgi:hypothetical protein
MAINKLWIIIVAVVVLLLVAVLALTHTSRPDTTAADAAHNAFMVEGGANDHETGVTSSLGSGQSKPDANETDVAPVEQKRSAPKSYDHETGKSSAFGSGQPKHN